MHWDIIKVKPKAYLHLSVCFKDGLTGEVVFLKEHLKGVFEALKDEAFFKQVFIDNGVVTWPGEIDLAPDTMYKAIKEDGIWVLD